MGRIMAIDYGTKRVGIAVTDPNKIIATALTTVHSSEVLEFLKKYFETEDVESLVVGEPRPLGNESHKTNDLVTVFVKKLKKTFPEMKIHRMDERYTSGMASKVLLQSGVGKMKRRDKSELDKISATIILQDFMQFGQ